MIGILVWVTAILTFCRPLDPKLELHVDVVLGVIVCVPEWFRRGEKVQATLAEFSDVSLRTPIVETAVDSRLRSDPPKLREFLERDIRLFQEHNTSSIMLFNRKRAFAVDVIGRNSAYYSQVAKEAQPFQVRYLVFYPDVPALNEHLFVYLEGHLEQDRLGIEETTFKLSGSCPDFYEEEHKITEFDRPVVRHGAEYGGPLEFGPDEMLFDMLVLLWPPFRRGSGTVRPR
ncbi:hypothetical protein K458DRAFT_384895 [Lentithecium fluviatile CBS 122367]|uniref:Uncharacterized protein n=1 Tax=Lentithecium fluviatile CBS 122367 TaxID=1168545 RepID=A0A6G1JEQ7_9PLEO|nr:hypothetical protein K458DRAFT_384895 [Lentithecium fluviatile CBS 122367]